MLISICIPQYNRCSYLRLVLESISRQTHKDLEIVVSDDNSSDETNTIIPSVLEIIQSTHSIKTRYIRQTSNIGYDANVRAALSAATGDYLFLLGNDDAIADPTSKSRLAELILNFERPAVLFCNSCDFVERSQVHTRTRRSAVLGCGPRIALRVFRCFSFFSGIILRRDAFLAVNTDRYDKSIYVQIYLACSIIARGGTVASISEPLVAKDVVFQANRANSYADNLAAENSLPAPKTGGLDRAAWVATEAIAPHLPLNEFQSVLRRAYGQILFWTYPYWLLSYRSLGVGNAARNLALGCRPDALLCRHRTSLLTRTALWILYLLTTTIGLYAPVGVLRRAARLLHPISKRH